MSDDAELLRRYTDDHDEDAFAELVRRHLALVYQAARRQTGDAHRAEDVAQAVFTDLARKARSLSKRPSLAGWLHTSTRYAAIHAQRTERRRQLREQEAHAMNAPLHSSPANEGDWTRLRAVLDDALHALGERDREAVLLRFMESRPFAEIGARLAMTEDAARMRVERALDKVRKLLARRGVTSTSAALALLLADQAAAAVPAGLAAKITTTTLALQVVAGGATAGLGFFTLMSTGKIITGIAVCLLGTALVYETVENRKTHGSLTASKQQQAELIAKVHDLENRLTSVSNRLRASEEDGAKLLAALDSAAADKTPPAPPARVPITHDYVESRYKHAQELAKAGQYEDALKEFLWCYDEGMAPLPEYGGVRYSYVLQMIAKLGETYPPALASLRERRDKAEQRILASPNDFTATMSFASINHYLKEDTRNLQFYDRLKSDDPRKPVFGSHVYDELANAQRYRDAIQAKPYGRMSEMVETLTNRPADIRQSQRTEVVKVTAKYVEVLAGTGDLDHARALIDRILAFNNSAEAKAILQTHLTRAGHPELLTVAPLAP